MKRLLGILLVVVLVVPLLGAGCGPAAGDNGENSNSPPITFQLATPTPTPGVWQPGPTIVLVTPTPGPGEVIDIEEPGLSFPLVVEVEGETVVLQVGSSTPLVGMVEPPEPGDTVVIMLNCEARAEELVILSQYLELRGYTRDLNAQTEEMYQALFSIFRLVLWWFPSWDVVPEQGVVVGILQVNADTVVGLPFVANIGAAQSEDPAEIFDQLLAAVAARDVDALTQLYIELGE